ncbi:MAG TPA: hypothetical protein VF730_12645 [Terracidiphilus sp.]
MSTDPISLISQPESTDCEGAAYGVLRMVGWFSAGLVVAALSIYLGAELRSRYLFSKRTPYDFYSNVGEHPTGEFGMGI